MLELIFAVVLWTLTGDVPDYLKSYRYDVDRERLTSHILRVCPKCSHAYDLADAILWESIDHGLDPALLTSIAWTESGYRTWVKGTSGEVGLWQLLPGGWLAYCYDQIRGDGPPWRRLSAKSRRKQCKNLRVGTYLAACMIGYHLQTCQQHSAYC